MTLSFIMLILAAGIVRYLAMEAKRAYTRRVASLLPPNIPDVSVQTLLKNHPEHRPAFRRNALPFSALQILFNALACSVFVAALWVFPPALLSDWDLFLIRYGGLLIVPIALVVDLALFARLLLATLSRQQEPDKEA